MAKEEGGVAEVEGDLVEGERVAAKEGGYVAER